MVKDEYLKIDFKDIKMPVDIDRRKFLKRLGGGILIICSIGDFSALHAEILQRRPMPTDLNVYLRIREDGKVERFSKPIEVVKLFCTLNSDRRRKRLESIFQDHDTYLVRFPTRTGKMIRIDED